MMAPITVTQLWIYPIKSLAGCQLTTVDVTARGLALDRRWMLVDNNGKFVSQRQFPSLSQLTIEITADGFIVYPKETPEMQCTVPLSLPTSAPEIDVTVWDSTMLAQVAPERINNWFSKWLDAPVRLVYMPDYSKRLVNTKYASQNEIVHFADGYPIHIISEESLDFLNERLSEQVSIKRFRPNIVVSGAHAHIEDTWSIIGFEHSNVRLQFAKHCARCMMVNIDPSTSVSSPTVLKTLGKYRQQEKKINFGSHYLVSQQGTLTVGTTIMVS